MGLIDKNLQSSIGYSLTNTGDFQTVTDELSTLLAAQNRILSSSGSWIYNDDYGSLLADIRNTPTQLITDLQIQGYIELAIQPMVDDTRIFRVNSVKITSRTIDSIQVQIELELELVNGILDININV